MWLSLSRNSTVSFFQQGLRADFSLIRDYIKILPLKYDTVMSNSGMVQSCNGEEWQRLTERNNLGRIVIVSNRVSSASLSSPGGLVVAVSAALEREQAIWFGWSGNVVDIPPAAPRQIRDGRLTRVLIDLLREDYEHYYAGFSNRALWPLLHYRIDLVEFEYADYAGYQRVNEEFARLLEPLLEPDDLIWVHDYHLILLGACLRARGIANRIGFFLHTPFPPPGILTTLPVHEDLVRGMCSYDVVGFQTDKDLYAFTDYIEKEAHGEVRNGDISAFGRSLYAAAFPISIDPEAAAKHAARSVKQPQCQRLQQSLAGRNLIIGVDRLDYSKGLIKRLQAVELLLESHPEYRRSTVVLQIASPTRGDVPEYQQLRSFLDGLVGHINGRFAEPDRQQVRYVNRHFSQDTLFGFYRLSSVGLVTPLIDGMNLVAKEFIATQDPKDPGVLVLSCFAGAARELNAALVVNPYDPVAVARALDRALAMSHEERQERYQALMKVLRRNDIKAWRDSYIEALAGQVADERKTERRSRHLVTGA